LNFIGAILANFFRKIIIFYVLQEIIVCKAKIKYDSKSKTTKTPCKYCTAELTDKIFTQTMGTYAPTQPFSRDDLHSHGLTFWRNFGGFLDFFVWNVAEAF
jgi:hypothetical protein